MKRIMIVEDEPIIAASYKIALEKAGFYIPKVFDKGEKAVKEILNISPDLILMDIKLRGELSGIEAAKLIQKRKKVPIIFISGNKDIKEEVRVIKFAKYMSKPVNLPKLTQTVQEILK